VVRAVQRRVGTAVNGSHRGAQVNPQQIVAQLDAERGPIPVAKFIRTRLRATPGEWVTRVFTGATHVEASCHSAQHTGSGIRKCFAWCAQLSA